MGWASSRLVFTGPFETGPGMTVNNAQVGRVLKGMGLRCGRRGKAGSAGTAAVARPAAPSTATGLTIESVIAAKKLADQLVGAVVAK